jgi:hypothetical protein
MENYLFYIGFSFLLAHELDAISCKEWRILPLISKLNDKLGYSVFVLAHIPIFALIFYQLTNKANFNSVVFAIDVFMIVHIGLHLLLLKHKNNEFKSRLSWFLIIGAGLFGLLDLILIK